MWWWYAVVQIVCVYVNCAIWEARTKPFICHINFILAYIQTYDFELGPFQHSHSHMYSHFHSVVRLKRSKIGERCKQCLMERKETRTETVMQIWTQMKYENVDIKMSRYTIYVVIHFLSHHFFPATRYTFAHICTHKRIPRTHRQRERGKEKYWLAFALVLQWAFRLKEILIFFAHVLYAILNVCYCTIIPTTIRPTQHTKDHSILCCCIRCVLCICLAEIRCGRMAKLWMRYFPHKKKCENDAEKEIIVTIIKTTKKKGDRMAKERLKKRFNRIVILAISFSIIIFDCQKWLLNFEVADQHEHIHEFPISFSLNIRN